MASIAKNPDNTVASANVTNPNDGWANGGVACATGTASGATATYNFTGAPFDLPDAASITGLQVDIKWGVNDNNDTATVELQDADAAWQSKALANKQVANCAGSTNSQLGADGDLWGGSFSRAHIESANFQARWTNVAEAKAADTYVDSVLVTVYYELASEELFAKFALQAALSDGSAELLGKFEGQASAELLGRAEIQHTGTPVELLGKFIVRQAASEDLLGKFTLRQLTSDLSAKLRVSCPRLMGENWQRKMWYDGTYYWRGRYDPTGDENIFEFIAAADLANNVWTKNAAASIDASGFSGPSACFTVRGGDGTIPTTIHYSDGVDTWVAESDEASATGWAWENLTKVFDATAPDWYRCPNLAADQQGAPQLWATAIFYDDPGGELWVKASLETASGDITGWDAAVDVSNVNNTNTLYGQSIRSMGAAAGVDMMVVYKEGDALRSRYYDGDWDDPIEDIDVTTFAGKPLWDFEQGMTPKMGHVLYVDADNSVQWTERAAGAASVWEAAEEVDADTSHTHVGLGIIEHGSGWLWVTWANQDTVQVEYRLHLCASELWMPPLVGNPLTFDATTDPPAVITTSTIAQLQTPDNQPAGSAVIITWIGETTPTTPCAPGWGIIVPPAHEDLLSKFDVGQDSADLIARFEAQASAELLGKAEVQQSGSAELLGKAVVRNVGSAELLGRFEAQASAELLGKAEVQQSGSAELLGKAVVRNVGSAELLGRFEAQASAELLGKFDVGQDSSELLGRFEAQASAELLGKAVVKNVGFAELLGRFEAQASAELLGKAEIQQSGSAELLGRFEAQASAELLGNAIVRNVGSADLLGKFEVQAIQSGSAELLGKAEVRNVGSVELLGKFEAQTIAELLGNFEVQQSGSAELLGRFESQASAELLGRFESQASAELLGKTVIRHVGIPVELLGRFEGQASAELLGRFETQASAELLGNFEVQQSGSAELLGRFESQASAELLGNAVIRNIGSAELLGKFEAQAALSGSAELLGKTVVKNVGSAELLGRFEAQASIELLGRFEAQAIAELLGKAIVRNISSAELLGRFEAQASAELLGRFEAQASAELLGNADIRHSDSAELLGRFEAQASAELLGNAEVQRSGSAELLADLFVGQSSSRGLLSKFIIQSAASQDLSAKFEVGQGSADLYAKFETQASAELLGKAVIRHVGTPVELLGRFEGQASAELLGRFEAQASAELLGNAIIRNVGTPVELLGKFEGQAIAELLGRFAGQASAELLGNFEVQQSGSADLLGRFEGQAFAELLGNFEVQQSGSADLLGRFEAETRIGSAELLGNVSVRQSGSAELLGKILIGQSGSAELLGKAEVQQSGSAELLGKAVVRNVESAELLGRFEAQASAELLGRFEAQASAELLGRFEAQASAELLGRFEAQASAELLGKAIMGHSASAELLSNVEVQQSGSAEFLSNVEVQQSDSAELLGKFEAQASAELLGKAEVQQSGSAELLGRAEIRQSASAELLGKFDVGQGSAELLGGAVVKNISSADLPAIFWIRHPYRLWTNRRYLNGVVELTEILIGNAILEYVIEGVMQDIQSYLINAGLDYSGWTNIVLTPKLIRRATTYGTVAALYARRAKTFATRVIPTIAPVTLTTIGDEERAMNHWRDKMNQMLEFYVTSQGGDVMITSTPDEEPVFTTEDIPPELSDFTPWYLWLMRREQ